jgi:menaquinone-9 beta-reductase
MSGPSYDAIVVGAGPGGSTAATMMSESGLHVLLLDKDSFPRNKVCGDAISGKSIEALEKLGLVDQFETKKALPAWGLTISGPSGDQVEIPFTKDRHRRVPPGIVCQREQFDDILLNRAVRAGVIVIKGSVTNLLRKSDTVIGVATDSGSETAHYFALIGQNKMAPKCGDTERVTVKRGL